MDSGSGHSSLGEFLLQEIVRTHSEAVEKEGFEVVVIKAWKELSIFMADFLGNALLKCKEKLNNSSSSSSSSSSKESLPKIATNKPIPKNNEDDRSCSKCGKVFAKARSRDFHEFNCGAAPRILWPSLKCPFCPLKSDHFLRFKKHVQECCPRGTTLCPRCFKGLPPDTKPGQHEGCEYILKCVKCKFIAGYHDAYRQHYSQTHLQRSMPLHQCHQCGKTFDRPSKLKIHSVTHTGERAFVCTECGKTFPRMAGLRLHREVHVKENLPCEICGKIYESRRKLRVHKNTVHPQEVENVKCPHCKAAFYKHATFMQHVTSVHPEEVEQCHQCGITYTSKADFEIHGCESKSAMETETLTTTTTIINAEDIMGGEIMNNEQSMAINDKGTL
nr:zinc finger protein 182-like isoform X2 [Lepeophtheirus salmonis]